RHDEAQRYYATALRIAPDEPSVLSNLGLSYALSKDLVRAEATLRRAAGQSRVDSRVQQNLALAVGLQQHAADAQGLARAEAPAGEANVAYLRQVLAQQNGVAVGGPGSGLISDRWRFGGGRAAGGDEAEGGDQCGEQGGADQRRVPHVWSPAEKKGTRPLRSCRVISAAKGQKMVNAAYPNQVNNR